ncbi:uncharacterized protein PpBr36_11388 [Pyricularia pennisetigena]|uniref:uncharacterized protein n=1 Tax=Pyricularia pennisetigena TaxID=1578925 RepID=UPI00115108BA|nr:uncharacterized protein PpBr36_11388 [Pyricularia pennisetigena]TLS20336.1 hypothetical protein PpBr36_11388 [Pyricularia pennisetigena]
MFSRNNDVGNRQEPYPVRDPVTGFAGLTTSFFQTWRVGGYGSSAEDVYRVTIHALLWDRSKQPLLFFDGCFNTKAGWMLLETVYFVSEEGVWDRLRSGADLEIPTSDFIFIVWASIIKKLHLRVSKMVIYNVAFVHITNLSVHRLCRVFANLINSGFGHVYRPIASVQDRINPRQGLGIVGFEDFFSLTPCQIILLGIIKHQAVFRDRTPVRVGWHYKRGGQAGPEWDTAIVVRMGSYFRRFSNSLFAILPTNL